MPSTLVLFNLYKTHKPGIEVAGHSHLFDNEFEIQ
jgi:hypothetical protein